MDVPNTFHIGSVTASTENHRDTCGGIDVRRCDERASGVVDERGQLCVHILGRSHVNNVLEERGTNTDVFLQALTKHGSDISALGIGRAETLCPANEFAVIDALLPNHRQIHGVGNTIDFGNDTNLRAWVRELERFTSRWSASLVMGTGADQGRR